MAVREVEFFDGHVRAPAGVDDDRIDDDRPPVAAVRAGVHPHAAAGRAGDRRSELEPAEAGVARAVQAHGVRRPASRDERRALDARLGQLAREPQHERVDPTVVDEQVRAEPDRLDGDRLALAPTRAAP